MREIKFRAWYKVNKTMYKVGQISLEKGTWSYEPDNKEYIGVSIPYQPSFILMQYTGLHDKNGKEIYEGDIVEWNYRGINKAVVFWDSIKAGFFITPTHCYKWRIEEPSYIRAEFLNAKNKKVIGNIYENSNLLKD